MIKQLVLFVFFWHNLCPGECRLTAHCFHLSLPDEYDLIKYQLFTISLSHKQHTKKKIHSEKGVSTVYVPFVQQPGLSYR